MSFSAIFKDVNKSRTVILLSTTVSQSYLSCLEQICYHLLIFFFVLLQATFVLRVSGSKKDSYVIVLPEVCRSVPKLWPNLGTHLQGTATPTPQNFIFMINSFRYIETKRCVLFIHNCDRRQTLKTMSLYNSLKITKLNKFPRKSKINKSKTRKVDNLTCFCIVVLKIL
jgi:hypothetical protein